MENHLTLYEHLIICNAKFELFRILFSTLLEIDQNHIKALSTRHPTKIGFPKPCGRTDDIMSLADGFQFSPVMLEKLDAAHPDHLSAIVAGHGKREFPY